MRLKEVEYTSGYFVSDDGQVFSNKSGELKPLRPMTKGHGGYEKVRFYCGSRDDWKDFFVHRLVAEAFVENQFGLPVVNHKDENPRNNNAENLEWCTVRYNNTYGAAAQKRSSAMKKRFAENPGEVDRMREQSRNRVWTEASRKKIADRFSKSVVATKNGVDVATYSSIKEAAEAVGAWPQNISNAIAGRRKTAMGFQWRFACGGEITGKEAP